MVLGHTVQPCSDHAYIGCLLGNTNGVFSRTERIKSIHHMHVMHFPLLLLTTSIKAAHLLMV